MRSRGTFLRDNFHYRTTTTHARGLAPVAALASALSRAGRSPRRPAQHGGSRQQKRKRLRWKASSRPGSGAYTCSRKASGRPQRAHASAPGPGSPDSPSHAGRPPTLLGNCSLRSLQAGASSAKPNSTRPAAPAAMGTSDSPRLHHHAGSGWSASDRKAGSGR